LAELGSLANKKPTAPPGPVRVGDHKDIFTPAAISAVAAHYHSAFAAGFQSFPYFAG
jgi:hypothetical protein